MYGLAVLSAVVLLILLLLEGESFLPKGKGTQRAFGVLTMFLSVPFALLQLLFLGRTLVYSPEFSALLVQGSVAWWLLQIALAAGAVAGALLWHVAHVKIHGAGGRIERLLLFAAALVTAWLGARELHSLVSGTEPRVYAYDLWWPPLVAWYTICLSLAGQALVGVKGVYIRGAVTSAAIIVVGTLSTFRPEFVDPGTSDAWNVALGAAGLAALAFVGIGVVRTLLHARQAETRWSEWMTSRIADCRALRLESLRWVVGVVVPVLLLGRIVHLETAGPSLALSALALAWVVLAEAFGGEPLLHASQWPVVRQLKDGSFRASVAHVWDRLAAAASKTVERLRPAQRTAPEKPSGDQRATAVVFASMAGKAVVAIAILVVLNDLPNAGRTIIYAFEAGDLADQKALAEQFPRWVVREMNVLERELTPLMIVGRRQEREQITAAPMVNGVDAAISKSSDLEYGTVKIPLSLIVNPIQTPIRKLLGARVITGALHGDSTNFAVVASSTSGDIWSARADTMLGGTSLKPVDALNTLAARLAFEIVAASIPPTAGLTRSGSAYEVFRQGLTHWQQYQEGNWDALPLAITDFADAVQKDPAFSLANYRLGIALQEEARPAAAAEAFAASIAANPTFAPSYVAKANVLYYFDWYRERLLPADAVDISRPPAATREGAEATRARLDEARQLWRKVLTFDTDVVAPSDRAASYYGLCSDANDHPDEEADTRDAAYAAYYYCRRAEDLYARLTSEDPQITTTHAWVLDTTGTILEQRLRETQPRPVAGTSDWHCSSMSLSLEEFEKEHFAAIKTHTIVTSPYQRYALEYYQRAVALAPVDAYLRCHAASAAYALGDTEPMRALDRTASAHYDLAVALTKDPEVYPEAAHRLALKEYDAAIERDPANTAARNGYAYRFWEWHYEAVQGRVAINPPPPEFAARAEQLAREAVRIGRRTRGATADEATLQSTLGEVLLAEGRPHEAMAILQDAAEKLTPTHTTFDQIRWDLAQAYRCAAEADGRRDVPDRNAAIDAERTRNMQRAKDLAVKLAGNDRDREWPQPHDLEWLDLSRRAPACVGMNYPTEVKFTATQMPTRRDPCGWLGVTATMAGAGPADTFVRVFGNEVNERIPPNGNAYVFLTATPADTHATYFARMEDKDGKVLSPTYPLNTYQNEGDNACSQNLITVTFKPMSAASSRGGGTR